MVIPGMIRTADERSGRHVFETLLCGDMFIPLKQFRVDILHNRKMVRSRPEILTKSQHLDLRFAKIVHRPEQLRFGLS
jgi:hypothetical protein